MTQAPKVVEAPEVDYVMTDQDRLLEDVRGIVECEGCGSSESWVGGKVVDGGVNTSWSTGHREAWFEADLECACGAKVEGALVE